MFDLPGGYLRASGAPLVRSVLSSELTGVIEETLSNTLQESVKSTAISKQLSLLISHIGDDEADVDMMASLSVADRTYAMAKLGYMHGYSKSWQSVSCVSCSEYFDASIDLSAIPSIDAKKGYPETPIASSLGTLTLHAPTGADQVAISDIEPEEEACRILLTRCLRTVEDAAINPEKLTVKDVGLIEEGLEKLALGVPLVAKAICPECNTKISVPFEVSDWLSSFADDLIDQVHELASNYHWSEAEILNLPRKKRHQYLRRMGYFDEDILL